MNRTLQSYLVRAPNAGSTTAARATATDRGVHARHNEEFGRPPALAESGFAPLGNADLESIFCHEETRTVQRDNTVTLEGVRLQITKQPGRVTCAGLSVLARRHLDGTHTVWWGPKLLGRYSPQGRALSREPIIHSSAPLPSVAVA